MVQQNNLLAVVLTLTWVLVFLIFSEILAHMNRLSKENARKLIHIAVGNVIFFIPFYEDRWLAALVPFLFVFGNYLLYPYSPIEKMRLQTFQAGHSFGTIYYPFSLSIVVFVFFSHPQLILASFFPVVYGDGLAAVFGPRSQSRRFYVWSGEKSTNGTLAMFFASFISVLLGSVILSTYIDSPIKFASIIVFSILVSVIGTLVELFSPKGMDNLTIPLVLMIMLQIIATLDYIQI